MVDRHIAGTHNYLNEINKVLTIELICSSLLKNGSEFAQLPSGSALSRVVGSPSGMEPSRKGCVIT